jgi:hypothetical protein
MQEAKNAQETAEDEVSNETLKYLGYMRIFQEVRAAMRVRSFLGVQNIFWNAWEKGQEKIRFRPHRGITPEEALKRGRFGEDLVFRWEKQQGRSPRNRADENLGYDIESAAGNGQIRFIEVKCYGGMPVELTQNEERAAKKLGSDYHLYVVHRLPNSRYAIARISDPARKCKLLAKPTFHYQVQDWKDRGVLSIS